MSTFHPCGLREYCDAMARKGASCAIWLMLAGISSLPVAGLAQQAAQTDRFLNRPLRAVATSGPGSSVDIVARLVGNKLPSFT